MRRLVLNTGAISAGNVLRVLAQFFAVPLLSRLLSPADYGLVYMAMPYMTFTMMLADAGVGVSLVRHSDDDHKAWSSCFWIAAGLGLCAGTVMAASAFVAALFMNEPRLGPMVMALALVVVAQGLTGLPSAALQRDHRFQLIAVTEIAATFISIGTAVVMALNGAGPWCLIGQQLALYGSRLIFAFTFSSFRPHLIFSWQDAKEHVLFGRDMVFVNFMGWVTRNMDPLVLGKALGPAPLGLYSMALQFVRLPSMLISGPLRFVMYAHLSKIKDRVDAIRDTYLLLSRSLALLVFPAMALVAAAYKPVFDIMLSAKWEASAELFVLVAPAGALLAVTEIGGTTMMVLGKTNIAVRTTFEFAVIWMIALLVSVWFGIWWVAVAYDIAVLIYVPRALYLILPEIECQPLQYVENLLPPFMTAAIAVALFELLTHAFAMSEWYQLFIAAFIGLAAVATSGLLQRRQLLDGLRAFNMAAAHS